jgi:cell division protein ZapA
MSEINKVRVDIFGEKFSVTGEADTEYIINLAKIVDSKMNEMAKTMKGQNTGKIAILAALNLADELLQVKKDKGDEVIEEKTKRLISLLDEGITGDFY